MTTLVFKIITLHDCPYPNSRPLDHLSNKYEFLNLQYTESTNHSSVKCYKLLCIIRENQLRSSFVTIAFCRLHPAARATRVNTLPPVCRVYIKIGETNSAKEFRARGWCLNVKGPGFAEGMSRESRRRRTRELLASA